MWDDFDDTDFDHSLDAGSGRHVFVYATADGSLIGHASVVPRTLRIDDEQVAAGYVEAVAVASSHRRQGIGGLLMDEAERILDEKYPLGALGSSDDGLPLYLSRGWQVWVGELGVDTAHGWTATPDEKGAVLVRQRPGEPPVSLDGTLTCQERPGDDW